MNQIIRLGSYGHRVRPDLKIARNVSMIISEKNSFLSYTVSTYFIFSYSTSSQASFEFTRWQVDISYFEDSNDQMNIHAYRIILGGISKKNKFTMYFHIEFTRNNERHELGD